jgi:hypothetical protein
MGCGTSPDRNTPQQAISAGARLGVHSRGWLLTLQVHVGSAPISGRITMMRR